MNIPGLSFAAFDVETANHDRGSVCSIGVVIVLDGIVEATHSWLCRPPAPVEQFTAFHTKIHGLTAETVSRQPRFDEVWQRVVDIIGTLPLVAHNAMFDIGAVRAACDHSGLLWPTLDFGCTRVWARRHLDLISYRLPVVAAALEVELTAHHDAAADAAAAAGVALALAARTGSSSVGDLAKSLGTRLGRITPSGWNGCRSETDTRGAKCRTSRLVIPDSATDVDPNHPLYGQTVAFTGGLMSMTRQDAMNAIAQHGAAGAKSVTRNTTLLVIGDGFTGNDPSEFTTGKAVRAADLRAKGVSIEVLTEHELLELLGAAFPR